MKSVMKYHLEIRIWLALFILTCSIGQAQSNAGGNTSLELDILIPPMEVFVNSAMEKNGMLNYRKLDINVRESDLKTKRSIWTQNFGFRGDMRYGTFNNFLSNDDGVNATNVASVSQQANYGIGLYIQLPVFDMWNRRNEIKRAKTQIAQAESLVKEEMEQIREEVIRLYEDVLLNYELLKISSSNFGNARVNMEMVDKEFRNGQIAVYEYVRLSDITARIQTSYETTKSAFLVSKKLLENTTGYIIK